MVLPNLPATAKAVQRMSVQPEGVDGPVYPQGRECELTSSLRSPTGAPSRQRATEPLRCTNADACPGHLQTGLCFARHAMVATTAKVSRV